MPAARTSFSLADKPNVRFMQHIPVKKRGSNHAMHMGMAVAADSAKLLGLDANQAADAVATSAADDAALAPVHAEPVPIEQGISSAIPGVRAAADTMRAGCGMTEPQASFEGPNGFFWIFEQPIGFWATGCTEQTYVEQYCSLIRGQVIIRVILRVDYGGSGPSVINAFWGLLGSCVVCAVVTWFVLSWLRHAGTSDAMVGRRRHQPRLAYHQS
jgi:hypothetical protein